MKKIKTHFQRWNAWRKHSKDSILVKTSALLGFHKPPSMMFTLTSEEAKKVFSI